MVTGLRLLRAIAWSGVAGIVVLSLLPGQVRPDLHPFQVTQLEHLGAYFVTGAVLSLAYTERRLHILIGMFLATLAAVLEISQLLIPGRQARMLDWIAGTVGAWAGVVLILTVLWWQARLRVQRGVANGNHHPKGAPLVRVTEREPGLRQ